jgi:tetratricopeptide (TPR) repeat protein
MRHFFALLFLTQIAFASADIEATRQIAIAAQQAGELETAASLYQDILAEAPADMRANYQLARVYARAGQPESALDRVEFLADNGFSLMQLLETQADFDTIRDDARFKAALERVAAARYPCETNPKKRDFDFWLGNWNVTQGGQFAGKNSITSILGGCALFEQWDSAAGIQGKSFNYYDPAHDHWRQIWIDDTGGIIEFTGKARDGGIFYTAETRSGDTVTYHKFEFTQNGDGTVRQFWQTSTDKTAWTTIWDGRYAPIETTGQ